MDSLIKEITKVALEYIPGQEQVLIRKLQILHELVIVFRLRKEEERNEARLQDKACRLEKGERLLQGRRFDGAVQIFKRLCEDFPGDASLHAQIGKLLFDAKHIECITFLENAVSLDPRDHASLALMGLALRKIKRLDQAKEVYLTALELGRNNVGYLFNLSRVCIDQCDWRSAQLHLRRALELEPSMEVAQKALDYASRHCRDLL